MAKNDENSEEYVLYTIVRENLNLPIGKLCAQVQHGCGSIYEYAVENMMFNSGDFKRWKDGGHTKVVLRASDKEFKKIQEELKCFVITDAGRTCVPSGTQTVLSLFPMNRNSVPKIIQKLQVL